LGKNRLRTVDFAITYRCTAKCVFCSAHKLALNGRRRGEKELSPAEIGDVMAQAKELGALHVNLTGGSPTVRGNELESIIAAIGPKDTLVSMVTNSILLTHDLLKACAAAGLDTLQLSLESMNHAVHDRVRCAPGNWNKLMRVLDWALDLRLNVCLSTVLTADNFDNARAIADYAKKRGVFCLLNPVSASGANADGAVACGIAGKKDEYYALLNSGDHIRADTVVNFRGGAGCPAGVERIEITPYGDVMTCPHVQVSYGNVREQSLAAIYERMCADPWLRDFEKDCRHVWGSAGYIESRLKPTWGRDDLPIPVEELEH
jgi:MoaA/NifB/PqqE/SkfB family radical SAM enzyme